MLRIHQIRYPQPGQHQPTDKKGFFKPVTNPTSSPVFWYLSNMKLDKNLVQKFFIYKKNLKIAATHSDSAQQAYSTKTTFTSPLPISAVNVREARWNRFNASYIEPLKNIQIQITKGKDGQPSEDCRFTSLLPETDPFCCKKHEPDSSDRICQTPLITIK